MNTLTPEGWPRGQGYAHAIVARGRMLVMAGQVGWDPRTRRLANGFAAQAAQALANIAELLAAAGGDPAHLARMTWYVADRAAYIAARRDIGVTYRGLFGRHYPAMSVIVVSELLDEGALVEIEATALLPDEPITAPSP
jgi:enamine deaminase RidA (YjgF/YER057c/UK114 family)